MRKNRSIMAVVFWMVLIPIMGNTVNAEYYHYGLTFNAQSTNQDERTGFVLTPEKAFDLASGFTMEFDLLFLSKETYGYVFRLIAGDSICLDLMTSMRYKKMYFVLANLNHVIGKREFIDEAGAWDNRYVKVSVTAGKDSVFCAIDGITQIIPYPLGNLKNIYISFGRNKHSVFHTTDVPMISLRNVKIRNQKGEIMKDWDLFKHGNNEVYDNLSHTKAVVENGIWEIDRHRKWQAVYSTELATRQNAQVATDTLNGRIFISAEDTLYIYYLDSNKTEKIKVKSGNPFRAGGSQFIYDNRHDRLISYSILYPDFVYFDFKTESWSDSLRENLPPIQHHNRFIDYENNRLIVFGGYGMHRYHSEIFSRSLDSGGWESYTLDCIDPRYLSAMAGTGDNKALIMGGYGSISGQQEDFPKNYNDLYLIDYQYKTCKKLIEYTEINPSRVFGNSMVLSSDGAKVYALAYDNDKFHTAINIVSVDRNDFKQSVVSDSIPFSFLDINSHCDLFYYSKTTSLYAVVLNSRMGGGNIFNLYSIAYPPLAEADVIQEMPKRSTGHLLCGLIPLGLLVAGAVFILIRKRKALPERKENNETINQNKNYTIKNSSIILLGGLKIIDAQGNDITRKFSGLLKKMFIYILLNTIHNGQGAITRILEDTFWFGMDKEDACNSRNVSIHRLRTLLKEIGAVRLLYKNDYWYMELSDDIFCDYILITKMLNGISAKTAIEKIVEIALNGALLPEITEEWIDDYKNKYSSQIIETLLKAASEPDILKDLKLLEKIADVILLQDDINEDAIKLKCKALYKMGRKNLSKNSFDRFYNTYKKLLNSEPNFSYEDLITANQTQFSA